MLCPNCTTENLITSERQNVQIDHCPRCRGVWLDRGELEKLIQMSSSDDQHQSERYNGRDFGEDEETPRRRGYSENNQEDDDDDNERGESHRGRDRDDDDRSDERGGSYRNPDRDYDRRTDRGEPEARSIWREIFENLGDRIPRP